MTEKDNTLLTMNGVEYRVGLIIQNSKAGPMIEVNEKDLFFDESREKCPRLMGKNDTDDGALEHPVVFYKVNGKFTILIGAFDAEKQRVRQKENPTFNIKGRLLSSVALKNAKVHAELEPIPVAPTPVPTYNTEFANRPRFQDERSSRYNNSPPPRTPYRGNKVG